MFSIPSRRTCPCIRNAVCLRSFSISSCQNDHYKTLGLPPHATKAQIKSHFYQLSKTHHPDVAKDAGSKDTFNALSEAYSVLSNDRERRAYDRTLAQKQQPVPSGPYHPRAPGSKSPRATHAWEYSPRSRGPARRNKNGSTDWSQHTHPGPQQHKHPGQHYTPPDPNSSYHTFYAGMQSRPGRKAEREERELDKVRRESGLVRAMQVVALIAVSVSMFGGLGHVGR